MQQLMQLVVLSVLSSTSSGRRIRHDIAIHDSLVYGRQPPRDKTQANDVQEIQEREEGEEGIQAEAAATGTFLSSTLTAKG